MKVLSLFDGISCGRVALERAGIKVDRYYASEIDKYAIQIAQKNYPDTIQIGDIKNITGDDFCDIDLIIGGSPCQGFSFAGKQLNFEDPRSKLFFEFARIIKSVPHKYFILENVKMKKEYQDIISEYLGVQPIEIDSALVSAQRRKRLYWTNIPGVGQPADREIMLKDIIHENEIKNESVFDKNCKSFYDNLSEYIVPIDNTLKIIEKEVQRGKVGYFRQDSQANRIYHIHEKAITLTGDAGGGAAKMGQYLFGCITPERINKRQNGQRFSECNKFYTLTAQDRHGIFIDGYIRKLTPTECERLQTLPDDYTAGVSNTQRYKMLGNGWTVDVIAHILKYIPREEMET